MSASGPVEDFINRWSSVGGSERANYQLFITELCALLDVPLPQPARDDADDNAYVFERRVTFAHGDGQQSFGFIDCYRRGAFVLEAKKLKAASKVSLDVTPEAEEEAPAVAAPAAALPKRPWPTGLPAQIKAVAEVLAASARPLTLPDLEASFAARGRWRDRLPIIIDTLEALGRARRSQLDAESWQAA